MNKDITLNRTSKYEVLAPAGSYECMITAFNAGADAVYAGGLMFGARAFAGNFDNDELIKAIDYAHLRGKKLFLTVNTLLKNNELKDRLYNYIEPLYQAGLDAVIVQDLGVLRFIKECFPKIDIHASTQMTVTGSSFAKELKEYGVTRIVPARELSYREIKSIYDETGLEIECFVHGALCYSYSGECLLSSVIGGRSGNRGRCAQPCRLPYDIKFEDKSISNEYPLSPKDLCTLENLPDILQSGVYSLKIEGRMKKPEYVASVTAMYRKYVDLYEKYGKAGYKVDLKDIEVLKDIYNRGGFTDGYYVRHNGSEMMSLKRPNHMGTEVALITNVNMKTEQLKAKAIKDIDREDVLEIFTGNGQSIYVKAESIAKGKDFVITSAMLSLKQGERTDRGRLFKMLSQNGKLTIMRTRNNRLIKDIDEKFLCDKADTQVIIGGTVTVYENMPVTVDIWSDDISVRVTGETPQPAGNRPVSEEDIRKQFVKTGGTDFVFDKESLNITVGDKLFVNIKELNRLRREALDSLKTEILSKYRRKNNCINSAKLTYTEKKDSCQREKQKISVLVSTMEQFEVVSERKDLDIIYAEMDICEEKSFGKWENLKEKAHKAGKEIYMALPYITRLHAKKIFKDNLSFFKNNGLDGYLFRNLETYTLFKELSIDVKKAVFDNTIYGFNDMAVDALMKYNPHMITASYELNEQELKHLTSDRIELCVYGYIPVMITAGCVRKSYEKCDNKMHKTILKDRLANEFTVINHCNFCYNVIYNSKPLVLYDIIKDKTASGLSAIRYNFVTESGRQVQDILDGNVVRDYTRGHFKRGVE